MPASAIIDKALEEGIFAGVAIDDNHLLVAVTEKQTVSEMNKLVSVVSEL